MYPLDEPALEVPCGYCGQPAGAWCVRRSRTTGEVTGRASYLHEARKGPIRAGWREGWRDGVAQVTASLRHWAQDAAGIDTATVAALEWAADRVDGSWMARRD